MSASRGKADVLNGPSKRLRLARFGLLHCSKLVNCFFGRG
jgi:hypothetical protein